MKKRRIILVHPRGSNWLKGSKKDIVASANRMIPHGILSIASWLLQEGHEVFIHDCLGPYASLDFQTNIHQIAAYKGDFIGFSATTSSFPDAARMAAAIKMVSPEVITVCGGVHCSSLGGSLLRDYAAFDFIVKGEGEITFAELVSGKNPADIKGLVWRNGKEIVENGVRELIPDLDILPFPAYEKLKGFPKGYNLPLFSYAKFPGTSMVTSRGCLFQCSYCDRSVFKKGFRYNTAQYIYNHLKYLNHDFGIHHVNIYDDLFTTDEERIVELCEMLTKNPIDIQFNCALRVGFAPDKLLKMLKSAGCLMVSLGIESADPELLKKHKAGVTVEAIQDTIARIQAAGLRAKGLFMMGLPGETEESIRWTSDFVMSLGLDDMNMAKFTPFPGAPLWKTIREEGALEEDWEQMNCLNFVFVPKSIGSKEILDELYNEHVKRFYTDRVWLRKFSKRIWQHRHSIWHIVKNLPDFWAAKKQFEPNKKFS
ncbi:MAG TPA: B12-binding domain-containing radical SAM protein [Firmicutes bacterium]|nr:B12-binding domain-containing radical SAM protein [Bacillota bacterium]